MGQNKELFVREHRQSEMCIPGTLDAKEWIAGKSTNGKDRREESKRKTKAVVDR